ncbi:lysin [Lactobacillus sp. CBA3605]|uniref:GH25 family lysozyme n=1 Tax=Lactobacillus sp. CBA3605 TaxID=2099788 RepID=UPI000CFE1A97|nr:GH25 family lysozyme [Lactobacillus sp. CBA3605]AVK60265.1 lysin [Lactobacillus sp. CBA3605]
MKFKNKLVLVGAATMAALFLGLNASAARMDMVDVSNNNGYMSTAEYVSMRNEFGVKALTVKISEGTTFKDGYAASNIANGQAAGLYVNGYHFAHYKTKAQAVAEADYAGQAAKAAGLPVGAVLATDVEAAEEQGILSQATNDRNNAAFMKEIQKFGYRTDIYTSGSWANNKMTIKGKTGWIAGYPYVMSGQKWYTNNNAWQWSGSAHFRISYGGFDVSQLYNDYYTAGQKSTVKPTDKDAVKEQNKVANKNGQKTSTTANWVKESKTYTLTTPVKLRTGASTSSSVITTLSAGSTIKTDQAIIQGGYRWVRQPRGNGYAYMATGPASNTLEYVTSGLAHTYYKVVSGDSWWVIAQRNGLSMTTLAAQNSKNIYSVIYPGQTLQLN